MLIPSKLRAAEAANEPDSLNLLHNGYFRMFVYALAIAALAGSLFVWYAYGYNDIESRLEIYGDAVDKNDFHTACIEATQIADWYLHHGTAPDYRSWSAITTNMCEVAAKPPSKNAATTELPKPHAAP